MRSDAERLRDILAALDQIRKHSSKGREMFERDELIQVWIVHHLARLGEAVARLSPNIRRRRAPWRQVIGMRSILVHEYFRIDPETVWTVVEAHGAARKICPDGLGRARRRVKQTGRSRAVLWGKP